MSNASLVHRLAVRGALPRFTVAATEAINVGFLAPLSGPVQSWGLPGLNGCQIWADGINSAGGMQLGDRRFRVNLIAFDCRYDPARARAGVARLVQDHEVRLLMTLGGDTLDPVKDYLTDRKVLTSTLLTSDLTPDAPYLIAPSELHPIINVTAVDWLARNRPSLRRVALCSQSDALGLPSLATYRAAFEAAGHELVKEIRYAPGPVDARAMVAAMLEDAPDILCWCTSYTPMVHALTEAAHAAGFQGQILSCTLDSYDRLIARTSPAFMEGTLFQFPDFDDPALAEKAFFFNQPKAFYDEYNRRFPDSWSAVSWEYAAILDIWHSAVRRAGSVTPISVLAAMKQSGEVMHAFGKAKWWGEDFFGINNALVGDWPVVALQDGKARIVEFVSIPAWLDCNAALLRQKMTELGQIWVQRQRRTLAPTGLTDRSTPR
jgi:branched-chain amino acid transport system substrate-binding protein